LRTPAAVSTAKFAETREKSPKISFAIRRGPNFP
jgi:hypothetical protein